MNDSIPPRPVGRHPTSEELYRARHEKASEEAREILLHAAGCARCSIEMARQEAFDAPESRPSAEAIEAAWQRFGPPAQKAPPALPPRRRALPGRAPALALAATLTLCVVGLAFWTRRPHEVERGEATVASSPSSEKAWTPTGSLAAPPTELIFPSSGARVRVKLFDAQQSYTWTSPPTESGRIAFPEEERQRLRPGVEYFWIVLGGDEEARSFRIEP